MLELEDAMIAAKAKYDELPGEVTDPSGDPDMQTEHPTKKAFREQQKLTKPRKTK